MEWFVVEIDRNFSTGKYGDKKEIYIKVENDNHDFIKLKHGDIESIKYFEEGIIEASIKFYESKEIEKIIINTEPNHSLFENTLYKDWKLWDEKYGAYDTDRSDYEPWCFNSITSLAIANNCYDVKENEEVKLYWNKTNFAYF